MKHEQPLEILIIFVIEGLCQFSKTLTPKLNPTLIFANSMPESGLGAELLSRMIGFSQFPIF